MRQEAYETRAVDNDYHQPETATTGPVGTPEQGGAPVADRRPWWLEALLPGRWTPFLLAVVAGLVVTHLVVNALRIGVGDIPGLNSLVRWLDVDQENGVPAWFNGVLLLLCAQALWRLGDASRVAGRRRWVRHERLLAVVFVYLSLDEITEIHEQTITPLRQLFGLGGILTFAWVVVAVPMVAVLGLLFLGYLRALPPPAGWLFVLSGAIFVGGAVGVELVGSALWSTSGNQTMTYAVVVGLEKGLEMLGLVVFLGTVTAVRARVLPYAARLAV